MKPSTTNHSADTFCAANEPPKFPPLELVNRPTARVKVVVALVMQPTAEYL